MQSGRTTPQDSAFSFPTPAPNPSEWPSQEQPGSGLTASAQVLDVSTPACTNGVWPPLRPASVAQKNKPSTMLSSNVQSIDLLMDCMAWRFWTMRQSNGCSTPAPRSSAAKQWFEQLAQKKKNISLSWTHGPRRQSFLIVLIKIIFTCNKFKQCKIKHSISCS